MVDKKYHVDFFSIISKALLLLLFWGLKGDKAPEIFSVSLLNSEKGKWNELLKTESVGLTLAQGLWTTTAIHLYYEELKMVNIIKVKQLFMTNRPGVPNVIFLWISKGDW